MSHENKDKADAAEAKTHQTRGFTQQVRVASRRKYTPEGESLHRAGGVPPGSGVNELCRREGIKQVAYYAWTKDFTDAGKELITRDTVGVACISVPLRNYVVPAALDVVGPEVRIKPNIKKLVRDAYEYGARISNRFKEWNSLGLNKQ